MTHPDTLETVICAEHDLKIDADLMAALECISEKRATIATLLANTNEHGQSIKPTIYERVVLDYQDRLAKVLADLEPLAHTIGQHLAVIAGLEMQIRERLVLVEDQIEEQTFRCRVGEFDEESRNTQVANLDEIKARLQQHVNTLEETYTHCETHLGGSWRTQLTKIQTQPTLERHQPGPEDNSGQPEYQDLRSGEDEDSQEALPPVSVETHEDNETSQSETTLTVEQDDAVENMSELALIHQPATAEQAVARAELQACLQLFNTKGEIETFEVGNHGLSIGKSSGNDIVLRRAGVSRKHATVTSLEAGRFHVVDLSGRGIGINGLIKEEGIIGCGDVITIAKVDLELMPAP